MRRALMFFAMAGVLACARVAAAQDGIFERELSRSMSRSSSTDDIEPVDRRPRGGQWHLDRMFRREIHLPQADDLQTVVFSFYSGGHQLAGGKDIAVIDESGAALACKILRADPRGETLVAFDATQSQGRVFVYFGGSSRGGQAAKAYEPKVSLRLTTGIFSGDALTNPNAIRAAVRGTRAKGMGFIPNVWLGYNPFGSDDRFVSRIDGYLQIDQAGTYRIFTNSDEASFVYIDDKAVVEWPGRHGATGSRGEHGNAVTLTQGLHKLEYLHAEVDGSQAMVLGWVRPGQEAFQVIPESAFVHTPVATVSVPERKDDAPSVSFELVQRDRLFHEKIDLTRVDLSTQMHDFPEDVSILWDFGDGFSRSDQPRQHVFVGDGPFMVSLKALSAKGVVIAQYEQTLVVDKKLASYTIAHDDAVQEYVDVIVTETIDKRLPNSTLQGLWEVVKMREEALSILPFVEALAQRTGLRASAWEVNDRLAQGLSITDPPRAAKIYGRLIELAPTPLDQARLRGDQIELILYRLKDSKKAMMLAQKVSRQFSRAMQGAIAAAKIGDIHRAAGDYVKAEQAYRAAAKRQQRTYDPKETAVLQTGFAETVATHIDRGELMAARAAMIQWEARFPLSKLSGDFSLICAKYYQALGNHYRALEELKTLVALNPLNPSLPEVELRMAISYAATDQMEQARKIRARVIEQYPNSRAARIALQMRLE